MFGAGISELELDAAALRALPRTQVRASERDGKESEFEGVALAAILERAGAPLGERLRGPALGLGVLVHAADGYQALFSLAELDPRMNPRTVLLADRREGAALAEREGPLRIVVPGEGRPARWVRQVVSLELVCAGSADGSACRSPAPTSPSR